MQRAEFNAPSFFIFLILALNLFMTGRLHAADGLAPLPLKLPSPGMGNNGPFSPRTGPHIEPLSNTLPRAAFLVPVGVTNVALNKNVTASEKIPINGSFSMITDGKKEAIDENALEMHRKVQWVQIDLEQEYRIYAIVVWRDFRYRYPVFRSVIVQAADDANFTTNIRTLFNNDYENFAGLGNGADKEYFETYEGKLIDAKGIKARYLRFYSNGSHESVLNNYLEIEAWGLKTN